MFTISFGTDNDKPVRLSKGKSLLESHENYVVVDLETTGLDPWYDDIIEIAAVQVVGNVIDEHFETLVNPGYEVDEFIVEYTGITNEMLSTAPELSKVIQPFLDFVKGSVVVGHNVNFDINFIYDNCTQLSLPDFTNNFIDTMRVSRRMFKEQRHHRLFDLVQRFGISENVEHRALSDAINTHKCYEYMKNHAASHGIDFASLYPEKGNHYRVGVGGLQPDTTDFDENTPVFGKLFVFTGTLNKMTRKEAAQIVVNMGGLCTDALTKSTNYLVLGNNDYRKTIKDGKSNKQRKAEQYRLSGCEIEIISENVFYDMLDE